MKKEIDWIKVGGIACSVCGALLTLISDYLNQKNTENEIAAQVEEQVKAYMDSQKIHEI